MYKILNYVVPGVLLLPLAVQAQFGEVDTFITDTSGFINDILIPILLAVAFLVFIIGVARYFLAAGEDTEGSRKQGKSLMLWGVFAFVVIVSIWGIVTLIANGLDLDSEKLKSVPKPPTGR